MADHAFVDQVEEANRTELERLGSDKALIAVTDATLEPAAVLGALAAWERGLRDAYGHWASDADANADTNADTNADARESYAGAADRASERFDRLEADLDDVPDESSALVEHLGDLDATGRPGGLVAAGLVADRLYLQAISFFINEADERSADLCRDLRSDAGEDVDVGEETVAVLDEDGRECALTAASSAIDAAYQEYVDRLDAMGLDPKTIC